MVGAFCILFLALNISKSAGIEALLLLKSGVTRRTLVFDHFAKMFARVVVQYFLTIQYNGHVWITKHNGPFTINATWQHQVLRRSSIALVSAIIIIMIMMIMSMMMMIC